VRDGESAMDHEPCQKQLIGVLRRISAFIGATEFQKINQWYDWALWYAMTNPRQTSVPHLARSCLSVRLRYT